MRTITTAALVAMLAIPGAAFATQAATTSKKTAAAPAKSATVAKHTTSGTVKSASDTALVISKGGKDETFVVNSSTEKKGSVDTGAHVTVHYTLDGKNMVATAISAAPAKTTTKSKGKK